MNRLNKKLKKFQLTLIFVTIIFIIMTLTMLLIFTSVFILAHYGIIQLERSRYSVLILLAAFSIIIGTVISMFFSHIPLAPLQEIISAIDRLAKGDFSARIHIKGPADELLNINQSFNHMAEELGSLEMLRSDFVNNFSHEFKTPIVSIRGFAKMLKYDNLTKEEHDEYLDIIISESERLTELATNVLNLSRIENQTIITSKVYYNVSEQIRRVTALLEKRWAEKSIEISYDCDEIYLTGNEELLKQVWINMIDNAIKFSPENSVIEICIWHNEDNIIFTFTDQGTGMSEETQAHIFDKFYQGDNSHATKGNGLGLALVRKIIELHGGNIRVAQSTSKGTTFEICLPVK